MTEVLAAIGRLERASSLEVLDSVVVERQGDGTVGIAPASARSGVAIDVAAWRWFLDGILEGPMAAGAAEVGEGALGRAGLSDSFVAEVRDLLATPGRSLMFIVSGLDPGAAVSELRGFPATRLVYGVLPGRVIDRMLTRPAKGPSRSRPLEP